LAFGRGPGNKAVETVRIGPDKRQRVQEINKMANRITTKVARFPK